MKKVIFIVILLLLLAGGGYLYVSKAKQAAQNKGQVNDSGVSQQQQNLSDKKGETTKVGTLKQQNGNWMIVDDQGQYEMIETYSADFATYEGQLVQVTGKYSGDTLFVSEIVLLQ